MYLKKMLSFNDKTNRYFSLLILLAVFCFVLYNCTSQDASSSKEEKVEMKRFTKVKLAEDFDEPTEMAIMNDGKVLVIERKGGLKLFSPQTNSLKQIASMPVYSGQEDGLLGLALDPQFNNNNFVYLYYSPVGEKPMQRVSRFLFQNDSIALNSEKIILEIPTQRQECCHSAGSIAFGPDENLFIAVGDNTNPHNPGYYNSIDEREGRESWDAQRTAGNTNDLRGKILRIHPEPNGTYTIPAGNLFPKGTDSTRPEIYVMGCRNPYRISVDAKKGWLFWGDVGQNTISNPKRGPISYDEWNVAKEAGFFGWPYIAGPNAPYADFDFATEKIGPFSDPKKPVNESVNNTGLRNLPPAKEALIWYSYDESKDFKYLGTGGKTPIAGPVYYSELYKEKVNDTTRHLPSYYDGRLFIAEWMRNWINVVTLKEDGKVDSIEQFMPGTAFNHPIDLEMGPDGVLYVLEYGTYWFAKNKDAGLYRIEYSRGNRAPIAELKADRIAGGIPLKVQFSSEGSYDLDSSQLFYKWFFDNNEVQSTEANPAFTFKRAGVYNVRLIVSDKEGKSMDKTLQIKAGNAEPEISLETSVNKSFYWSNTPIPYKLNVVDKEDGSLQGGTIQKENVKVTLAYNTMGTDLTTVAQAHEGVSSNHPGFALMEKSDCKSCHALNNKSVGPSYTAIAERYKKDNATTKKLASKIISGGSGVWGEYVMSAHPQLSVQQASQIVSYILSVKDDNKNTSVVPPAGVINPGSKKDKGEYILSVTYQDKERMGVPSNLAKKNFHFKYPMLKAANAHDDKGVAKLGEVVRFAESGSWILFKNIDLNSISSILYSVDPTQIGGRLSLHLDTPGGKEISSVSIDQIKRPQKTGADQKNNIWKTVSGKLIREKGVHDLYVVYNDPQNAKSSIWTTLYLDWIKFRK
jgi:cytochrome c